MRPFLAVTHESIPLYSLMLGGTVSPSARIFCFDVNRRVRKNSERKRREWLDQVGELPDGTVIDVQELPADSTAPRPC